MNNELVELSKHNVIISKVLTMVELNHMNYVDGLEIATIGLAKENKRLYEELVKSMKKERR